MDIRNFLSIAFLICQFSSWSQVNASFSTTTDLCLEESVSLTNTSVNATAYEWDFCIGDFEIASVPTNTIAISGQNNGHGYSLVEENGIWYSFVVSKGTNSLIRLTHGSDPTNNPTFVENLGGFGLLTAPEALEIIEFGGNWYGVIGGGNNGANVTRLDFPNGISGDVLGSDLGNFGFGGRIRALSFVIEAEKLILVFAGYNSNVFYRIDYGDSFDNTIDLGSDVYVTNSFGDLAFNTGFDVQKITGNYIVHALSLLSSNVIRLNFGNSILNEPIQEATYPISGLSNGYRIQTIGEGDSFYALVGGIGQNLRVFDFGDLSEVRTPIERTYSTVLLPAVAFEVFRYEGNNYVQGTGGSNSYLLSFEAACDASQGVSTDFEPAGVSYSSAGTKEIWLQAFDADGDVVGVVESLEVTDNQAPVFSLETGDNLCIANEKSFTLLETSVSPHESVSYQWDFDNDGTFDLTQNIGDSDFGAVSVDYTLLGGSGDYTMMVLATNASGCSNMESLTFTLFDAPLTPTEISATASSFCTFNEITFSYPPLTGLPAQASLIWNINDELVSTEDSPVFTFNTSGLKSIDLQVIIPNCTTSVYTETIAITAGPNVAFSYTNNCFGEAVMFTDESDEGTEYTWDFGDGSPLATSAISFDPTHVYLTAGTYTVTLTVASADGCATATASEIIVSDQPLASLNFGDAVTNVPTVFTGIDQTLADNAVTSWTWDFDGLGSSDLENPSFTFSSEGDFEVSLTVVTSQGCEETIIETVSVEQAEFPTPDFSVNTGGGCLGTALELSNTSINATAYEWDFCIGDFKIASIPTKTITITQQSDGHGYSLVEENGIWYSFVVSKGTNSLIRLTHGSDPTNNPTFVENLGGFGLLTAPEALEIIEFGGNWYGVIGGGNNGANVTRLDFPNGISGDVLGSDLGNFGFGGRIRALSFVIEAEKLILVFAGYNSNVFYRIDYGDSFDNTIDLGSDVYVTNSFGDLAFNTGFDVQKIAGNYIVHALSFLSSNVIRLNFGNSLLNEPIQEATYAIPNLSRGYRIHLISEGDSFYGVLGDIGQNLRVFDFGDLSEVRTPIERTYSTVLLPAVAFEVFRYEGNNYVQGTGGSNSYLLSFEAACDASQGVSTDFEPAGVSYSSAGTKEIWLQAFDADGDVVGVSTSIEINTNQAPVVGFSTANRCVSTANLFDQSLNVVSYAWDFNSDDIIDSTEPNPTFQFSEPGTYDVRLDVVSDEGCGNFVSQQITIYPEPPVPIFEIDADAYCQGSPISLINLTDDTNYDGLVSYHWNATGSSDTITSGDLSIIFQEEGVKTINVFSSIPGCESAVSEQTIDIFSSPTTEFTATEVCIGELTCFTNMSEAADYLWDFGDGVSSTLASPDHLFAEPGTYNVTLSSIDPNTCTNSQTQSIVVLPLPLPAFSYGLVCKNDPAIFEDLSFVPQSDIVAWDWVVDGVSVATDQNPSITFETSGIHDVSLTVLGANGCAQTYQEEVSVLETPELVIAISGNCVGEPVTIVDATNDQQNIQLRSWLVDGLLVQSTSAEFQYTFTETGVHEIQLNVDQRTGCSGTTILTIELPDNPALAFEQQGFCENDEIIFTDLSTAFEGNEIQSRTWKLDGTPIGNGFNALLPAVSSGSHVVELEVETAQGCNIVLSETIEVAGAPLVAFAPSTDYGVPPFSLTVENQTTMATSYEWFLNGSFISEEASPLINIRTEGDQVLKLVAFNDLGCVDSSTFSISAVLPIVDIEINQIQLVADGAVKNILLRVTNHSNLPIETFEFGIELENTFALIETVQNRVNVGQTALITLNTSVPIGNEPGYLCVSVHSIYETEDLTFANNERCISVTGDQPIFESPYPNPTRDNATVRAILPQAGGVSITVFDMSGQVKMSKKLNNLPSGLNVFNIELDALESGTYFVRIQHQSSESKFRVIKH